MWRLGKLQDINRGAAKGLRFGVLRGSLFSYFGLEDLPPTRVDLLAVLYEDLLWGVDEWRRGLRGVPTLETRSARGHVKIRATARSREGAIPYLPAHPAPLLPLVFFVFVKISL